MMPWNGSQSRRSKKTPVPETPGVIENSCSISPESKDPEIGSVTITRAYLEKHGGPRIEMREYSTADKSAVCQDHEACYKAE